MNPGFEHTTITIDNQHIPTETYLAKQIRISSYFVGECWSKYFSLPSKAENFNVEKKPIYSCCYKKNMKAIVLFFL